MRSAQGLAILPPIVTAGLLVVGSAGAGRPPLESKASRRLLYLTHSAGFKHDVLPLSERVMQELGESTGAFEATVVRDGADVSAEKLGRYRAIAFYTTGELPMSEEQKSSLLDFVRSGGGFVGIHSATDTFYKWPAYGELIGGYFDGHPWHQEVTIRVEDLQHPATRHLQPSFSIKDEIYQFKNWSRQSVHVLLTLDVGSVDLSAPQVKRNDRDFALAWSRGYGKGRVFYTALGHRSEVWQDGRFRQHLTGGIRWAMGENQAPGFRLQASGRAFANIFLRSFSCGP